eukprot:1159432-Pelagomonas_calceolata.AAC.5
MVDATAAADAAKASAVTSEVPSEGHARQSSHGEGAVHGDADGGNGGSSCTAEAAGRLRTQLVDLATRKSYATKDAGVGLGSLGSLGTCSEWAELSRQN